MNKLTAYELIDIGASMYGNAATMYAIFLTILSGYLIVAYAVGAKLTSLQVTIVNILYIVTALTTLAALGSFNQAAMEFSLIAAEVRGTEVSLASYFPSHFLVGIDVLLVLGSLKFMWDVRPPGAE